MEAIAIFNRCLRVFHVRKETELMYPRFLRFIEEAHRDGVIGDGRYAVALGKASKLQRFLIITKRSSLHTDQFNADMVLDFRRFISQKRFRNTTVVHDLKLLQAFFAELENTGEIRCSPFRKISAQKRRVMMHVMYDAPVFLRAEEVRQVMATKVPAELQWVKDLFVLNCAVGCRISDLLRLTPDKVTVSDEGIPFVHYIPSKTAKRQSTNSEVITPLIEPALEIINRTGLQLVGPNLKYEKQRYNKTLRQLLKVCGITRRVSIFCLETGDNVYRPLYEVATSKLARKTHIDMLNKVQINYYAAGLHRQGSEAVFRYTGLELRDRYELLRAAFSI